MNILHPSSSIKPQTAYNNSSSGFTLVELLVVITLFGIIGTMSTQIFILGFKSLAKVEILKEVKQNGDYIQTVMENMSRNALDIGTSCSSADHDQFTIINQDGNPTTFLCADDKISSVSGLSSYDLSGDKVKVNNCVFRLICPVVPDAPKYLYLTYTVTQAVGENMPPQEKATINYQTTVSLRSY